MELIHSYRESEKILALQSASKRAVNNNQKSIKRDRLIATAARQAITKNMEITAICDGANNCCSIVDYLRPYRGR